MATSYTENRKIGALSSASTPLDDDNEIVINQNGDILKTPLSAVEAKVFDAKNDLNPVTGTEVVVVRQTDNTLRQVQLNNIVKPLLIANAQISASAAIEDTKLATINTAGKVTNTAVQATDANTANRIVARDGSGNFAAGTITATLSGNASTATFASSVADNSISAVKLQTDSVIEAKIASGAVSSAKIANETIVNDDISGTAGIVDTKLATISTAGKVSNSATTATNANTASAIVARDASGNFSAGTITANLTGNASGSAGSCTGNSATATTLGTSQNFQLAGDVTSSAVSFNGSSSVTLTGTLADNAVTTAKILNANVTPAKLSQPLTLRTAQASTSGSSFDFTDIPSWVKRITVMFSGVSHNQNSTSILVQLGDAGGIENTGYVSTSNGVSSTSGFVVALFVPANSITGHMVITKLDGNLWISSYIYRIDNGGPQTGIGSKTLSDTLDRVRITTTSGSSNFDAGTINISYEG